MYRIFVHTADTYTQLFTSTITIRIKKTQISRVDSCTKCILQHQKHNDVTRCNFASNICLGSYWVVIRYENDQYIRLWLLVDSQNFYNNLQIEKINRYKITSRMKKNCSSFAKYHCRWHIRNRPSLNHHPFRTSM